MTEFLQFKDQRGFCNLFLSAIGGEGANTAAKLVFDLAVGSLGLDGGYDAKYGSEKKGTPTYVSVRLCDVGTPVRVCGPTNRPHFLVAFHDWIIAPQDLGRGLHPGARVIINSVRPHEQLRDLLHLQSGRISTIPATRIAKDTGSRLNVPLLAVLGKELGLPIAELRSKVQATWPHHHVENLAAFDAALTYEKVTDYQDDGRYELTDPAVQFGSLGYLNMLSGGTIDALTHSTYHRKVRLSGHGFVPQVELEHCTGCALCLSSCADPGALIFHNGKLTGIDPEYCKGCMRCSIVCPATRHGHALSIPAQDNDHAQ